MVLLGDDDFDDVLTGGDGETDDWRFVLYLRVDVNEDDGGIRQSVHSDLCAAGLEARNKGDGDKNTES